jgi:hypothetical protein
MPSFHALCVGPIGATRTSPIFSDATAVTFRPSAGSQASYFQESSRAATHTI